MKCPYCGARAVDITCNDEVVNRYLCTGLDQHEFTDEFRAADGELADPLIVL